MKRRDLFRAALALAAWPFVRPATALESFATPPIRSVAWTKIGEYVLHIVVIDPVTGEAVTADEMIAMENIHRAGEDMISSPLRSPTP